MQSTAESLPCFDTKNARDLFAKYHVLSSVELNARSEVLMETYVKVVRIEARTLITMVKKSVLPIASQWQATLADNVGACHAAGVECPEDEAALKSWMKNVSSLRAALTSLEHAESKHIADYAKHMRQVRDEVVPAMAQTRLACDAIEPWVPNELWTLPTYAEMLLNR
jgi:glutamine synthetase